MVGKKYIYILAMDVKKIMNKGNFVNKFNWEVR